MELGQCAAANQAFIGGIFTNTVAHNVCVTGVVFYVQRKGKQLNRKFDRLNLLKASDFDLAFALIEPIVGVHSHSQHMIVNLDGRLVPGRMRKRAASCIW
jgi:hypothetical protein